MLKCNYNEHIKKSLTYVNEPHLMFMLRKFIDGRRLRDVKLIAISPAGQILESASMNGAGCLLMGIKSGRY